jgi:hypothetical protein
LCGVWLLPSASDDISFIEGVIIAEPFELMEVIRDFCQFQSALYIGFGAEMGLGLSGIGVSLLVAVDHLVVGDAESIKVSGNSQL